MSEPTGSSALDAIVAVTIVDDVDPFDVRSDARAQVVEHELRRRLPGATLTIDFRSVADRDDPRRRSLWRPARGGAWRQHAATIVDIGSNLSDIGDLETMHVPLPDLGGWFAELVDPAALEARRLMLGHLGITEPTNLIHSIGLTATDHLALGSLAAQPLDAGTKQVASAAFDRIAELIGASAPTSCSIDELVAQIESLRSELLDLRADRAAWEHATNVELERRAHALRSLELRLDHAGDIVGPS